MRALCSALLLSASALATLPPPGTSTLPVPADYDPTADAAAVVVQGALRVTVLTPRLLRLEVAINGSFDDRATLSVVNRRLPVPAFTVGRPNATALTITTADLALTYSDGATPGGGKDTCASPAAGTDVADPVRSPAYPNGTRATSVAACCALCNSDASCRAWVFSPPDSFCFPLATFSSLRPAANRTVGGSNVLPPGASLSIAFSAPGGGTTVWQPGAVDAGGNLNGTYTALDCYSTPMECNAEYYGRMQPGLLSLSGWTLVDDTNTGRFVPAPDLPAGMPTWWTLANVTDAADWYFAVTPDLDFKRALGEWASIMGRAPMLPASAYGVWWSRYYNYSQAELEQEVLEGYANNSIPLNNLVCDME